MKTLVVFSVVFLWTVVGVSQQAPRLEVFAGYSLLHIDTQGVSGSSITALCNSVLPGFCPAGTFNVHRNLNGWTAGAQANLNRWVGVKADISGHYGTPLTLSSTAQSLVSGLGITGFPPRATSYSFLFGPVLYRNVGRYTPFAHALFGANRVGTGTITVRRFRLY